MQNGGLQLRVTMSVDRTQSATSSLATPRTALSGSRDADEQEVEPPDSPPVFTALSSTPVARPRGDAVEAGPSVSGVVVSRGSEATPQVINPQLRRSTRIRTPAKGNTWGGGSAKWI